MKIQWADALEAFYGTQISDKQVPVWEHYLIAENTNSAELVKVIEMAAAENIKPQEWRVTIRDLKAWLILHRSRTRKTANAVEWQNRKNEFIRNWREKLSRGADRDDFLKDCETFATSTSEYNDLCKQIIG
jgi:hypothetical protein